MSLDKALPYSWNKLYAMAIIFTIFKTNDNTTVPESLQQLTTTYESQ